MENEKQFVAAQFPLVMSSYPVYFPMKPAQSPTQDAQFQHRSDMWCSDEVSCNGFGFLVCLFIV